MCERYDNVGFKIESANYTKGKLNGEYKTWNHGGEILQEGNFVNDTIKVTSISRILEKVALILGKNQLAVNASKVED